jgi:hypothetical protein
MRKPKRAIEVLPSKQELALDRLTEAVLQRIADKDAATEAARPETDLELSESVLPQPWCLPRTMHERRQPTLRDLHRTREEFRGMLERRTKELKWQNFFSDNPYVLSMSLPLRLKPQDIIPMGRPGFS